MAQEGIDMSTIRIADIYGRIESGTFTKYEIEQVLLDAMGRFLPGFKKGGGGELARLNELEEALTEEQLDGLRKRLYDVATNGSKLEKAFTSAQSSDYFHTVELCLSTDLMNLTNKLNEELSTEEIKENRSKLEALVSLEPDSRDFVEKVCYFEEASIRISAFYLANVEAGEAARHTEEWEQSVDLMHAIFLLQQKNLHSQHEESCSFRCKDIILNIFPSHSRKTLSFELMLEAMHLNDKIYCESNYLVRPRCLAHKPLLSTITNGNEIPMPAALCDALSLSLVPEFGTDSYNVWTTTYLDDFGAKELGDAYARPFQPKELFVTRSDCIRKLAEEIGGDALSNYDENGCRILVFCAGSYYDEDSDVLKFFGAARLRDKNYDEQCIPESGEALLQTVKLSWMKTNTSQTQIDFTGCQEVHKVEMKVLDIWTSILHLFHGDCNAFDLAMKVEASLTPALGTPRTFSPEPRIFKKHYYNPLMFRNLRHSCTIDGYNVTQPLGGTLTDVQDGENYILSQGSKRRARVQREGNELRLLRRGVPRIVYQLSRMELSAGVGSAKANIKTDTRTLVVNQDFGTSRIIELLLSQHDRPDAVKYALSFMEDVGIVCSESSACFLRRDSSATFNVSAVLTAKTLNTADCYVDVGHSLIYIMIGSRLMLLEKIRDNIYHAKHCAATDYTLQRAHVMFDNIIVGARFVS